MKLIYTIRLLLAARFYHLATPLRSSHYTLTLHDFSPREIIAIFDCPEAHTILRCTKCVHPPRRSTVTELVNKLANKAIAHFQSIIIFIAFILLLQLRRQKYEGNNENVRNA
jgi:hypothetical protein